MIVQLSSGMGPYECELAVTGIFNALKKEFPDYGFEYLIGGQISFDVVPKGWDKTYCLQFLKDYDEIHFFGDRTQPVRNWMFFNV